ncbi:MAG: membrane protein insertion efficiency factor YidD [Ignavibacteria bacterium]|jgi:putative component of membrane protein insertase Oxa1/YidC/SpoIIIJ protein YidD
MKNLVLITFFLFCSFLFAQDEWEKWGEEKISYELPKIEKREYKIDKSNLGMKMLSGMQNAYYFLISDLDGDNCPFRPTCSSFWVKSVKETNIFQGSLMFSDRFVRDLNVFKAGLYPVHKSGHYYDPPQNYSMDFNRVEYFPKNEIVDE